MLGLAGRVAEEGHLRRSRARRRRRRIRVAAAAAAAALAAPCCPGCPALPSLNHSLPGPVNSVMKNRQRVHVQ